MAERKVSIYGLGHVGLVTAVCLAKNGYDVLGVDPDTSRLRQIREAHSPFFERDLSTYLKEVVENGKLRVTDDTPFKDGSNIFFITVGTPSKRNGSIDLAYVRNAAHAIGRSLHRSRQRKLIVIKSTVTPGTARNVVKSILERESGKVSGNGFDLCSNPEFLREGNAIHDTEVPDRIIVGSEHQESNKNLIEFYEEYYGPNMPPVISTTHENAELIKYANNSFLAMKVSFANCMAGIAELVPNADVESVTAGIGLDERIGPQFLNAGLGWGGSCFPKDLAALLEFCRRLHYSADLIEATVNTNEKQWRKAKEFARKALGSLKGKKIAVLGIAFKPETDDIRAAPSIPIIKSLIASGASVTVYDPSAAQNAQKTLPKKVRLASDTLECIRDADCCIAVTEWEEFRKMPPQTFAEQMKKPIVIDGRRIWDANAFTSAGIQFYAIGLGPQN